jgi:hypothetical protein
MFEFGVRKTQTVVAYYGAVLRAVPATVRAAGSTLHSTIILVLQCTTAAFNEVSDNELTCRCYEALQQAAQLYMRGLASLDLRNVYQLNRSYVLCSVRNASQY